MSWLTVDQAAKRAGRGPSTIRRWIGEGLPAVGGRISEADLIEFERAKRAARGRPRKVDPLVSVLVEVAAERERQRSKWGEQNHPDGTGENTAPLVGVLDGRRVDTHARLLALLATAKTDREFEAGRVAWRDILLEEVFEALAESDAERLRVELVQVAAVATQWVEAIDRRDT